ncbi:ATP-binding protein [Hyphococcus sp.]|uniref:sensor histidine kinase n=1 Tax=Hyphococcus sp. TaxID=2038636 RepID=UPI003CCBF902
MEISARTHAAPQGVRGFLHRFRAELRRDGISASTAEFKDNAVEDDYRRFLVASQLKTERLYWWGTIFAFYLYLILDLTTVTQSLSEIVILRILVGLACAALIPLSYIDRFKPHFGYLTAAGMLLCAFAVIAMISMMQATGAPPYIIGVLVTFIASSCLMRIPFRIAASVYIIASAVYLAVLNLDSDFQRTDVISGHFFMISIASVAVMTNYSQEIRSRIIWVRDEQRKRDAETIEKLLIEATAADRSKINFLSMMSHELRTPLHQIIGYTEVVTNACKAANDDGENLTHLNEIHGSAYILLSRIQKMLRYADATAGKMKYELAYTPVSELIEASIEQMRAAIEKKGLRIDASALVEKSITIDIVHTCYALNNIIENAVTASPQNGVIWIAGDRGTDGRYDLTVRDEGEGMTQEQISEALQPFTQGENALVRSREGMGLGLTLAGRIFRDQNADISLASNPGQGLSVTISFTDVKTDKVETSKKDKPARAAG